MSTKGEDTGHEKREGATLRKRRRKRRREEKEEKEEDHPVRTSPCSTMEGTARH